MEVISLCQYYDDVGSQKAAMKIISGSEQALLHAFKQSGMEVLLSEALNMSRSPHLFIAYLLKVNI